MAEEDGDQKYKAKAADPLPRIGPRTSFDSPIYLFPIFPYLRQQKRDDFVNSTKETTLKQK